LAAKFIDKIKVYCYRTPCIFRTTYKALFMSSYIVHFQQIMHCLSRTLSRSNESHLCRHLNVSILPSASPSREDARSIAVDAIILPRAFNAMPSVTIVVELSHTLDLMDSRRLPRPRPWNLLEISSSSYPRVATSLLSVLSSHTMSVHCLGTYNGQDLAILRKWKKKRYR